MGLPDLRIGDQCSDENLDKPVTTESMKGNIATEYTAQLPPRVAVREYQVCERYCERDF